MFCTYMYVQYMHAYVCTNNNNICIFSHVCICRYVTRMYICTYMYNTYVHVQYNRVQDVQYNTYVHPPNPPLRASFLFPSFSNSLTLHTYILIQFPSSKTPDSRVSSHLTTYYYLCIEYIYIHTKINNVVKWVIIVHTVRYYPPLPKSFLFLLFPFFTKWRSVRFPISFFPQLLGPEFACRDLISTPQPLYGTYK